MHGTQPKRHSPVQVILLFHHMFYDPMVLLFTLRFLFVLFFFHALHTQYNARTDPSSSGAAFHAAQVHPDELNLA